MAIFFKKIISLEKKIDQFLHKLETSGLIFSNGIKTYLDNDQKEFKKKIIGIEKIESEADVLKREIEYDLYKHMLIPELRSDVYALIEKSDNIINKAKKVMVQFLIEQPCIPSKIEKDLRHMIDAVYNTIESMTSAHIAYFKEINMINNYISKAYYYEKEVDHLQRKIVSYIFNKKNKNNFIEKMYYRDIIDKIAMLSDKAKDICEHLSIYSIKRSL